MRPLWDWHIIATQKPSAFECKKWLSCKCDSELPIGQSTKKNTISYVVFITLEDEPAPPHPSTNVLIRFMYILWSYYHIVSRCAVLLYVLPLSYFNSLVEKEECKASQSPFGNQGFKNHSFDHC